MDRHPTTLGPLPPHRGEQEPHEDHAHRRWLARSSASWSAAALGAASLRRVARSGLVRGLGIYLLVYVSWLIWGWIPFDQNLVGQVILLIRSTPRQRCWRGRHRARARVASTRAGLAADLSGLVRAVRRRDRLGDLLAVRAGPVPVAGGSAVSQFLSADAGRTAGAPARAAVAVTESEAGVGSRDHGAGRGDRRVVSC